MKIYQWNKLTKMERNAVLARPAQLNATSITESVDLIKNAVFTKGDAAILELTEKFDKRVIKNLEVSKEAIRAAEKRLDKPFKNALKVAYTNIKKFHEAQKQKPTTVITMKGVECSLVTRPIHSVGLYIPGGSAPLFSTVLMLTIPAKIAGCKEIVLASPPPIADEILYAAKLCGVNKIYQMGGAQAIFGLGLGTKTINKVDKIFGPGNSYVTEAKRQVSQLPNGPSIDMPAGPSEVLVITDGHANPDFVASDLLSQAEHGSDSQVILVSTCNDFIAKVNVSIETQLKRLSRAEIAKEALSNSLAIYVDSIDEAINVSNQYAPEHLILQFSDAEAQIDNIENAGSIFVGAFSPESMGDYASGTNHVLPTYGYAKTYSSLGIADFSKRITIQKLSEEGFSQLAPTVALLAEKEQLDAHKLAVTVRIDYLKNQK